MENIYPFDPDPSKPHGNDLRNGRYSIKNGIYLTTFVTRKREPLFRDFMLARIAVRQLSKSNYSDTLAFVVMPNHVHWLIQLRTTKNLSQVVQATKAIISRKINRHLGRKGTIWQAGFHDHALRNEGSLKEIARYVVANPIRAKLVRRVGDYPYWDAVWVGRSQREVAPTRASEILAEGIKQRKGE